ncbi:DUF202 domain-containing protein [Crocosphaera chwakensis]|uniref:DUF202 domain-containing protein n=1 Tax=Crocosphaera chwakensis CCY0110 TaxID=391612 RepID=A3IW45_9CHRO|nr:DUF202 domain-containing protein [Crocosphaera chwakensis]EAZ89280.1 hypothetical protein CY0110_08796 [Crocosphaera chwakensis CCY0110]
MSEPETNIPNNNDLAMQRTDLAQLRTELATERNILAKTRTDLSRERTRAAQERTLMAWIRTSLSMISFGFGIDRFFSYLNKTSLKTGINTLTEERILGLSLMSLGIFALGASLVTHWRTLKNIEEKEYKYVPRWSQGFTVGIILLFIALAAFIPLLTVDFNLSEIFTLDSQVIQNLLALNVFLTMLTMGVKIPFANLISLKNHPQFLGKSLLSVLVIFPVIVAFILLLFNPGKNIAIGLILIAASPAPPLLTKRTIMSGGNVRFAASLQVILSLLAVIVTPLALYLFSFVFPESSERIDFILVAKQVATVQLLPLSLGLLIRKLSADLGEEIGDLLLNVVNTLFLVVLIFALGISLNLIPSVGWKTIVSIALIVMLGLIIGHLLGGIDDKLESRSTLATATIARNVGLALYIAIVNSATNAIPGIVAYAVLGAIFALPYNVWVKNKIKFSNS